ncbi:AMP-dependent synthetase [Halobacteriales archaeon QS_1_69_70]|nr:MAG: AMP-dependent synthetase [Halobacteriales archaeon QS_1_69_70]
MQRAELQQFLPDKDSPDRFFALPELKYPREINAAVEMVDRHVEGGRGDDVAVYSRDRTLTFAQLKERSDRLGNALRTLDVAPGDRVFVRFPNRPEYVVTCLAIQKIGAIPLPSMKLLRAEEIEFMLSDAEAHTAVVAGDLLQEVVEANRSAGTLENVVVAGETERAGDFERYGMLLEKASPDLDLYETTRDDLALMAYTSGTTGRPKGTVHTHRELLAICDGYARYCLEPTPEDVFSGNPPIAFTYGYGVLVAFPLRFGASTALLEDADSLDLLEAIEEYGVTVMGTVPTAYNQMFKQSDDIAAEYDISSLRLLVSAGEPLPEHTYERLKEEIGVETTDGLGTTEMLHVFISHRLADDFDPSATGLQVPGYECKVVDPDTHEEVPRGEPGVLAVRGPTGIRYWNRPDEQSEAVHNGWNYPGDIFVHREDGRFEYKSRRDDLIITAGYNVPGPEVEGALEKHPEVSDAAVVASPDEERNQIVKAFVVLSRDRTGSDELIEELQGHVKDNLAPFKYPRAVEFVNELPRTETGKIRRTELRECERRQESQVMKDT